MEAKPEPMSQRLAAVDVNGGVPSASHPGPEQRVSELTEGLYTLLAEAVDHPKQWHLLLDASATMWRYSGGNVALLMMQMAQRGPVQPSLIAGYKEWERHRRYVLKGEHALYVIAPRTARITNDDQTRRDPATGERVLDEPGDGTNRSRIVGWRGQAVFDVSQTEGEPLLVPVPGQPEVPLQADSCKQLWKSLTGTARNARYNLVVSETQVGLADGYTDHARRLISVGSWLDAEERVATLAHELAHASLHVPGDSVGALYGSSSEHRGLAEIEAESVAYVVLRAHGIDRGRQSAAYLAGWADAVLEAEADSILRCTRDRKPMSRVDIAKSVLGRVTSVAKTVLETTNPPGSGGKLGAEISVPGAMTKRIDLEAGLARRGRTVQSRGTSL
ncbi:ArdC-like ssDNA-binding domain-containing protein [Arthrobacter sp. H14-L1]|uniref:ArdC-like ssDNA-binding domain-containing protein n=1 Tax=Arthrobacter sp. H14-L1 TaxID=2996697 RepID=UPI00226D7342|nr:ArdC-like ssDNA-binding domain-containing protein [Arthrobacter sp. H14-L1]MCY0903621.1 ArdC-like ssDNA-binding domain-containing protein [Arthrobacter sp. H14-L1]